MNQADDSYVISENHPEAYSCSWWGYKLLRWWLPFGTGSCDCGAKFKRHAEYQQHIKEHPPSPDA